MFQTKLLLSWVQHVSSWVTPTELKFSGRSHQRDHVIQSPMWPEDHLTPQTQLTRGGNLHKWPPGRLEGETITSTRSNWSCGHMDLHCILPVLCLVVTLLKICLKPWSSNYYKLNFYWFKKLESRTWYWCTLVTWMEKRLGSNEIVNTHRPINPWYTTAIMPLATF